jgi:hypothetical protein
MVPDEAVAELPRHTAARGRWRQRGRLRLTRRPVAQDVPT